MRLRKKGGHRSGKPPLILRQFRHSSVPFPKTRSAAGDGGYPFLDFFVTVGFHGRVSLGFSLMSLDGGEFK
jgi:hypothetical protein